MAQYDVLAKAADTVAQRLGRAPVGVVLGSGLSEALDNVDHPQFMPYADIPGLAKTSTAGHRGALLHGHLGDTAVLGLCGRLHMYEGRTHDEIAAPVRLLSLLGVHTIIVTTAVSSTDPELPPGSVMFVEDHLNLSGGNVLAGDHDPRFGPRFPDMVGAYDPDLIPLLEQTAEQTGLTVSRGVLAQFLGPTHETSAEVRMVKRLGARVVSVSMVPEVLVARQRGMRIAGIACVTHMAAGIIEAPLDRAEMLKVRASFATDMQGLLSGALPRLAAVS